MAHTPTDASRAEVSALASFGVPQDEIAAYLGFSRRVLARNYQTELRVSSTKANAAVAQFLYTAASGRALKLDTGATYADCVRAAMFWMKTRARWRETSEPETAKDDMADVLRKLADKLSG